MPRAGPLGSCPRPLTTCAIAKACRRGVSISMMYILFSIGSDRYALDSSHVVEIVPRVELWQVPKAPSYVAGVFRYRGRLVPVLDLCWLMHGELCPSGFTTRIVLVLCPCVQGLS